MKRRFWCESLGGGSWDIFPEVYGGLWLVLFEELLVAGGFLWMLQFLYVCLLCVVPLKTLVSSGFRLVVGISSRDVRSGFPDGAPTRFSLPLPHVVVKTVISVVP